MDSQQQQDLHHLFNSMSMLMGKAAAILAASPVVAASGGDSIKVEPAPIADVIQAGMKFTLDGRQYTVLQANEERVLCEYFFDARDGDFIQTRRQEVTVNRSVVLSAIAPVVAPVEPTIGMTFMDGETQVTIQSIEDGQVFGTTSDNAPYVESVEVVKVLL